MKGKRKKYALRFGFQEKNNEAEYEALITSLRLAREVGARRVKDFFLAADGDNVGPRAQPVKPVALLEKPNFLNIASVEANPTNTQAHLPKQSNQSKSALRLSRLSLCLCTLCLSLLLKITRSISPPITYCTYFV